MPGYVRQDTTNEIEDGNTVKAPPLDAEFDAIVSAFSSSSGHRHNGAIGEGAPITVLGPLQDLVISSNSISPKTDNVVDLGTSLLEFKDLWLDGTANIDTLAADAATVGGAAVTTISNTQTLTNKTINLTNNTLVATSAQVAAAVTDETGTGLLVFSDSPALAGVPTAPTAVAGTNTTQLATTEHVFAERTNAATLTNKTLTAPVINGGTLTGVTAPLATALATPRSISVTGDLTGTPTNFDGTANISIPVALPGRLADGQQGTSAHVTDVDDIDESGFYVAESSASNTPVPGANFQINALFWTTATGSLLAQRLSTAEVYVRNKIGGVWGSWTAIPHSGQSVSFTLTQSPTGPQQIQARSNLGLGSMAIQNSGAVTITGGSVSGITDLAVADGGTGASTAGAARTNLGLGTIATQNSATVAITGGTVTGITDLAIADGGTGASTAVGALVNLGLTATAAEINILDGATVTTAEINVLDGIPGTLTATELGYVDGVTSSIQTQLNGKQASGATLTSLQALSLVQGDVLYATGANTLARLPKGTAGQFLQMNSGATAPEWFSNIYESGPTATTSGTTQSFTGIPAGVNHIDIMFDGVSASGSSDFQVQIGTGGTPTTTGYSSNSTLHGVSSTGSTTGFNIDNNAASHNPIGTMTLDRVPGSNKWVSASNVFVQTGFQVTGSGVVTLAGVLDNIQLSKGGGTFSDGSWSIRCRK